MPERGSKSQQCQSSEQLLEFFRRDPNDFLSRLVTMDDTWLYHYDPETKQQSTEWRHSGSPRPKKFRVQTSAGKVIALFLGGGGSRRNPPHLLSSKGPTINAGYYLYLLVQLKDILMEKRRGKVTKGVLFLHNAPSHGALATQKKLAYLGLHCLDHPPYSPDLVLSHYHLFPGLKKRLKGRHFSSDAEVIAAAETWFDGQPNDFF